jgi:hypothetical protein
MTTPTLVEASNTAPVASVAQGVLAEAQSLEAAALATAAEANPPAEPRPAAKLSWDEAIKRAPPAVAELMKGMQADYTKKTQEVADQRKEIAREREALLKLKFEAPAELGEYDPFDEGSVQKRIEAEVTKRMRQLVEPMQQEAELLKAESDYASFVSTYPDFKSDVGIRSEVQRLLEANPNLDLETAYFAAKGKQTGSQASAKSAAERKAAQAAAQAVSSPRKSAAPSLPDKKSVRQMSTVEILAAAKAMHR